MTKSEKIKTFDPNAPGTAEGNIFGLPFSFDESEIIIIPVPWEVTVSYRAGTAKAPEAVFAASSQVDLYDPEVRDAWKIGLFMEKVPVVWEKRSASLRKKAVSYLKSIEKGKDASSDPYLHGIQREIDRGSSDLRIWLKEKALDYLNKNKLVAVLGGDHSTPLGLIEALSEKFGSFGILHFDAHFDLRKAYEGFKYSHASVMFNVLGISQVKKIVSVGIRDFCEEEVQVVQKQKQRVVPFYNSYIQEQKFQGKNWDSVCNAIVKALPNNVYISFDIDGLDAKFCPNTGTPVPGGLEFDEAVYLVQKLVKSGKRIIGLDLNEVAPGKGDEWDANIGARLLYRLCNLMAKSNGKV